METITSLQVLDIVAMQLKMFPESIQESVNSWKITIEEAMVLVSSLEEVKKLVNNLLLW